MGYVVAAMLIAASLLVLWISTLLSRRWYVTLRKSDETEVITLYLARIAEALERLAPGSLPRIDTRNESTHESAHGSAHEPINGPAPEPLHEPILAPAGKSMGRSAGPSVLGI